MYFSAWLLAPHFRHKSASVRLPAPTLAAVPAPLLKSGVPSFVRALGLKPGTSTERDLERRIGAGEVCVGGHSNSGRYWSFANGLALRADGFDRASDDSLFIDSLVFEDWNGPLGETPELKKYGFGVWSGLRVGMSGEDCLQILSSDMPTPVITQDEITWTQQGLARRNAEQVTFDYDATLRFSGGKLKCLLLDYYALDK